MEPKKLEVSEADGEISITWSDGHDSKYSPFKLRGECPCAVCRGEPGVFGRYYKSEKLVIDKSVQPEAIQSVGRYGIKILWSDKHDLGIYSYDYLRQICECDDCKNTRTSKKGEAGEKL